MSSEDENKESRQLKLSDKAEKKSREKSDKKWILLVLLVSVLLSLGFYFIAGDGMSDVVSVFASKKNKSVEIKKPVLINESGNYSTADLKSDENKIKPLWDRMKDFWIPAVYEF
jgi:hypothetical protein